MERAEVYATACAVLHGTKASSSSRTMTNSSCCSMGGSREGGRVTCGVTPCRAMPRQGAGRRRDEGPSGSRAMRGSWGIPGLVPRAQCWDKCVGEPGRLDAY